MKNRYFVVLAFFAPLFVYWVGGGDFYRDVPLALAVVSGMILSLAVILFTLWGCSTPRKKRKSYEGF